MKNLRKIFALTFCLVMVLAMASGCRKPVQTELNGRYIYSVNGTSKLVMEYSGEDVRFLNESDMYEDLNSTIFEGKYTVIDGKVTIKYASNGETYALYEYNAEKDVVVAPTSGMEFTREITE